MIQIHLLFKIPTFPRELRQSLAIKWSPLRQLVTVSLLAVIAALLMASGNYLPGIGLLISPFSTLPVIIGTILSLRHGVFTYILATLLLLILQPGEFFMFTFTTGLLGISLGWVFCTLSNRISAALLCGILLTIGICIPLYLLKFPVLGPTLSSTFAFSSFIYIFLFSIIYSYIWIEMGLYLIRKIFPN